jgi:hypothetical protein
LDQLDADASAESMSLLRDILTGSLALAKACPEVSRNLTLLTQAFANCPSAMPAVSVTAQCLIGSLVVLDSRSSAFIVPGLKAVQSLLKIALAPALASLDPSDPKVAIMHNRLAVYDLLTSIPPALGRQHYQRNFRNVARTFTTPSPVLGGLWTGFRSALRGLTQRIMQAEGMSQKAGSIDGLTEVSGEGGALTSGRGAHMARHARCRHRHIGHLSRAVRARIQRHRNSRHKHVAGGV